MQLQFSDIQGKEAGKTGFVLGLGPSLKKHLPFFKSIDQKKEKFKIISCNNIDRLTDIVFDYWMLAQPADDNSLFCIANAYNRYNCYPRATLLYTDCLDLTPRDAVARFLNIDYLGYDQRHFGGRPCTWSDGPGGRHICCNHIIPERLCIQEVFQKVTKSNRTYSCGDTVGVHMLALAVILGMKEIYVTGIDLDYTNGYVHNDLPGTQERIEMGISSMNNSPAMVQNILDDLVIIRDAAALVGVQIYCMDEGLKISKIFPYKDPAARTGYTNQPVQDMIPGGVIEVVMPSKSMESIATTFHPSVPIKEEIPNTKPADEYAWENYTEEYRQQLNQIKEFDGQEFFITEFDVISSGGVMDLVKNDIVFKNKLHPNWMEIYFQAWKLQPKSVFEVGFGGGYHLKNIQKMCPDAHIAGCDLLQTQLDFAKEFSQLPHEIEFNLQICDFTKEIVPLMKYEFVFSQAVVMHQSTEHAKAMLKNMGQISSKYILLVEGIANHLNWYDLVKECLPDFEFEIVSQHIDYGILLTKKTPVDTPIPEPTKEGPVSDNLPRGSGASVVRDNDTGGCGNEPTILTGIEFSEIDKMQAMQRLDRSPRYNFEGKMLTARQIAFRINEDQIKNKGSFSLKIEFFNTDEGRQAFYNSINNTLSPEEDYTESTLIVDANLVEPVALNENTTVDTPVPAPDGNNVSTSLEADMAVSKLDETVIQKAIKKEPEPLFVFTEIIGCGEVGRIALESFHKHHNHKVHIFSTEEDYKALGPIADHENNVFINAIPELVELYMSGHAGTAHIFAQVFSNSVPGVDVCNNVVHFDSDVYFKCESLAFMSTLFANDNFDIIGSRRCYFNNPANIPVELGTPDTVSTYFFGMKRSFVPSFISGFVPVTFKMLSEMFIGHNHGLDHEVFDFADCVVFNALKNGAKIAYINPEIFGGQDEFGKKNTTIRANLHIDAGGSLIHFGGAGSGCACFHQPVGKNESYGKWAVMRYSLFCKIFLDKDIPAEDGKTTFDKNGRWVSGNYNEQILNDIRDAITTAE